MRQAWFGVVVAVVVGSSGAAAQEAKPPAVEKVRIPHEARKIEGWTVHVDTSLLAGEHAETGALVLKIMAQRLHRIAMRIPEGPLEKLREVPIYLDRKHPLGGAHFHPAGKWLEDRGYDPSMAKAVHLTEAGRLIRSARKPSGGAVLLHELAHAYHNRVLGFDHAEILEGYRRFRDSGRFESVAYITGSKRPHYGLMNPMEYFAEMTEAFFAVNDFHPFVRCELAEVDPHTYRLLGRIWGVETPPARERRLDRQDLMILATVTSERGLFNEALKHLDEAERRAPGNERVASLRRKVLKARAKAEDGK